MSEVSQRIANWLWRDVALRAGFREVVDTIPPDTRDRIIDYWAARIEEEIGDNRFIAALTEIRDADYRGNRHESAYVAARALGPRRDEQAAAGGVTQYAADGAVHVVQQDLYAPTHPVVKAVAGPIPATGPTEEIADI